MKLSNEDHPDKITRIYSSTPTLSLGGSYPEKGN